MRLSIAATVLGTALILPSVALGASCVSDQPSITVEGQGRVEQTATHIDIRATFTERRDSSQAAVEALQTTFEPIYNRLKADLADDGLRSDRLDIRPIMSRDENGDRSVEAFRASHTLTLVEVPIAEAGERVEQLSQADVSRLSINNESAPDNPPIEHEALTLAVENARERAGTLATALGQPVGEALCVNTTARGTPTPRASRAEAMVADAASAMKVEPGTLTSQAVVEVVFSLATSRESGE